MTKARDVSAERGGGEKDETAQHFDPERIRKKLERILTERKIFFSSAKSSFEQFDDDGDGRLSLEETAKLLSQLCTNLQLPPIEWDTLERIFTRHDVSGDGSLQLEEFCNLYFQLLCRVRDRYYPRKEMRIRRGLFVRHVNLKGSIEDIFTQEKKLGSGSFGEVYLMRDKITDALRVCKIINKDRSAVPPEQIEAEVAIMKSLDHPNVVNIHEVYEDYHSLYIIMEYCAGGELLDRIRRDYEGGYRWSEEYVGHLIHQLLRALNYVHRNKIVHKDLKPENLLFTGDDYMSDIKLIDFGLAEIFGADDDGLCRNSAGTALYMAPEVYRKAFTYKCDVWSAGVMMYLLLTGRLPFYGETLEDVKRAVCYSSPNFRRDCHDLSKGAVHLLEKMLTKDPNLRPSVATLLEHPWIRKLPSRPTKTTSRPTDSAADSAVSPFSPPPFSGGVGFSPEIRSALRKYMRASDARHVLLNLLSHHLTLSSEQINHIKELFLSMDRDGDGTLSRAELSEALQQAKMLHWDISRIVQTLDVAGTGSVSYSAFLAACVDWKEQALNQLWAVFKKMDLDGDGTITIDEFMQVLTGGDPEGKILSPNEVRRMVAKIDTNGNGYIEWHEFAAYVKGDDSSDRKSKTPPAPLPPPSTAFIGGADAGAGAA